MAEINAIVNWNLSPFEEKLNEGVNEGEKVTYAFFTIPKENFLRTLNTTVKDNFITVSCPIDAIQAIFPKGKISITAKDGNVYPMLLNKVIVNDDSSLKVVIHDLTSGNIISTADCQPSELISDSSIDYLITKQGTTLAEVNISISVDPVSCIYIQNI